VKLYALGWLSHWIFYLAWDWLRFRLWERNPASKVERERIIKTDLEAIAYSWHVLTGGEA
jgi:hypothetical protein